MNEPRFRDLLSTRSITRVCLLLMLIGLPNCEQAFEPIHAPEDLYLSMFGFLDASAPVDTQWVRVSGIRNGIHTSPDLLDAVVTLEHLGTGRSVVLRDSAFTYQQELGSELHAVNFWTTEPIEPGAEYRLVATRSDGASATATVRVPEPFPSTFHVEVAAQPRPWPQWSPFNPMARDIIRVEGVQYLALTETLFHIPEECVIEFSVFRARQPLPFYALNPETGEDVHTVSVTKIHRQGSRPDDDTDPRLRQNPVPCHRPVTRHAIHLVASGSKWLDQRESPEAAGHMDMVHNVENGRGFMDGVITATIPYGSCWVPGRFARCVLVYGPESASVQGTVRDDCDDRPLDALFAFVTLVEIDTERERTAGLDRNGFYEMAALVPGEIHEVRVTVEDPLDFNRVDFEAVVDTVAFEIGEERTLDIRLRGLSDACFFDSTTHAVARGPIPSKP